MTPQRRGKLRRRPFFDLADRHDKLYDRSRLYASAQGRHETGGVLSLFSGLSFDISMKSRVQKCSSDFQGLLHVKIRKMALGSNDLSTLPLNGHHCGAEIRNEFSLSVAKHFRPLCSDSLKRRDCSFHRKKKRNQINTKNYWK